MHKPSIISISRPLALYLCLLLYSLHAFGQKDSTEIYRLIDSYVTARETRDTTLLKNILTPDIDQLVSSGEWRLGLRTAVDGMLRSSTQNPGTRTITVDKMRYINTESAIVDTRYVIENPDGSQRKMWSTFIVVYDQDAWRITGIRNMLPSTNR